MPSVIEVRGLKELQERMKRYPEKLKAAMEATTEAALYVLWEKVPSYPPPPETSTYVRTGTLGRTLGSDAGGGKTSGEPDVFEVRDMSGTVEGHFGTNLEYAPYVIGDETQAGQNAHWWTMNKVAEAAAEKIKSLFATLAEKLAAFLEGKV